MISLVFPYYHRLKRNVLLTPYEPFLFSYMHVADDTLVVSQHVRSESLNYFTERVVQKQSHGPPLFLAYFQIISPNYQKKYNFFQFSMGNQELTLECSPSLSTIPSHRNLVLDRDIKHTISVVLCLENNQKKLWPTFHLARIAQSVSALSI